jgi:hypothetical protein
MYYSILEQDEFVFLLETAKQELRRGDTFVEMGAFALGTIGRIAKELPHVYCQAVDIFQFDWLDDNHETRAYLENRFPKQRFSPMDVKVIIHDILLITENLTLNKGHSRSKVFMNAGLQFIDADHNYPEVMADFWHCWSQAREGSLIIGHDYHLESTARAVHDIEKIINTPAMKPVGSMWAFRKEIK